ncbi:histidine phosphatase family protein [Paracoccus shanxieyensis]|uniref:Histidine phosphatase family protein n=1 Tax=Paracoccus shanxieyensis TaxID=2675752 RepID=A0A6L6J137_9RHOB|nr:histidine phosphatase family protein [Paracoccus shanxieyensis]MTH65132.1 histidine phosphatase family protein [Paracoccus shanxieyensis]MTH88276.1 histidine phosphatase family protein [Paracoccus shanxieyensis]
MPGMSHARILIARHAPLARPGLAGRRDVPADCSDLAALDWLRGQLGADCVLTSPALRCRQTCAAMGMRAKVTPALWEQDFGAWETGPIPDLGPLPVADLAAHRPDGGESFDDMAARVQPVLQAAQGSVAIVAHAGTVRAALALVVGPDALSFAVAPLSLTILTRHSGIWAVEAVNRVAPP